MQKLKIIMHGGRKKGERDTLGTPFCILEELSGLSELVAFSNILNV